MNKKSLYKIAFAIIAIQFVVPHFNASESTQVPVENESVRYAIEHPTKAQVQTAQPTDIVVFEDPELEKALSWTLGVPVGNITVADMGKLTIFSYMHYVSNFSGMEYAVNLERIDGGSGKLSDLTPLSNLTKLSSIYLAHNEVSDLSPLANIKSLTNLQLTANKVSDLTPIAGLTNLTAVSFDLNNITDISPLSNLTNLQYLALSVNNISDISPLSNLVKLEQLRLLANQISDISDLKDLTNLNLLDLGSNNINDISPLSNMANLTELWITRNQISDISPIQANPSLKAYLNEQTINLPDKTVFTDDEVVFNISSIGGTQIPVSLGVPLFGENIFTANTNFTIADTYNLQYDATITQKVTLTDKFWKDEESINEGKALSDDELKTLFNVVDMGEPYTVDQSAVDYHTPGTYQVTFETAADTINTSLVIADVMPEITVSNSTVQIKLGETIADYLESFGITATEIIDGDLTHRIIFDDSKVDYNRVGSYQVDFKIIDDEGNEANVAGNVTIEDAPIVTPEVEKSEIEEQTTKSEADTIAMTADDKELSSTGNKENIILVVLSILVIGLFAQKRKTIK